MPYRIDNPGGGDCGFYALAIGLINAIQEEYKHEKTSNIFALWQSKGLNNVSLEEILEIDLNQLYDSPYTYKKETLFKLVMSLRDISANASKDDLLGKIADELDNGGGTKVESSPIFHKFMELVHYFMGESKEELDEISHFNELAFSDDVILLAEETAQTLKPKLERLDEFPEEDKFSAKETIENNHVKNALVEDVILPDGKEDPNSVILKGTEKIQEKGIWATHSDLKEAANQLGVNLYVAGENNGVPNPDFQHTISLNNEGKTHWTTNVEKLPEPKPKPIEVEHVEQQKPIEEGQKFATAEQVIAATVSSQIQEDKVERYQQHVKALLIAASSPTFFSKVQEIENLETLDTEQAAVNENGVQESDEDFAMRLQEAEFRRAKLK